MLSYRGHYKSCGKASEQGVYNDAEAAILQLKKLGVAEDNLIIWGHSLGTAVAIETALNRNVLGVILQCPIKEIKSAAIDVYKFYGKKLRLLAMGAFFENHIQKIDFIQKMDSINKIERITSPILVLHSKADRVAPWQNSVELAQKNPHSELYLSDAGNHWASDWCLDRILEFVKGGKVATIE